MVDPAADVPVSAVDTAILGINVTGQPYVVTLAGLLGPGGFVDADGHPDLDRVIAYLGPRVEREPELLQRPQRRDGRWWWVRAPVEVPAHVRVESAAAGGFEALCGRKVMEPLPHDRPLWQITLVPSARPGRCGIIVRLHHAVVDGARASALLERLLGSGGSAGVAAVPAARDVPAANRTRPSITARVRHGLSMFLRRPIRSRALLGPVGPDRDVASTSVDLGRLEAGALTHGATVNDAYLVAVGQGLRAVLADASEPVPDELTVSVPVKVHARGAAHNAVGVMLVAVPLGDPDAALRAVARRTSEAKPPARASGIAVGSPRLTRLFNFFTRHQRVISTVASNVRGPRLPLDLDGAPLVEMWALGPLAGNLRVGFTAVSYAGRLWVGVETDARHLPPAARIADAVGATLQSIAGP